MEGYSASIKTVSRELTAKERIQFKDTTSALKLDECTQESPIVITPSFYGVLAIHNEKSDNVDYENYIIVDEETGEKYVTGSASFWSSFMDIAEEMKNESESWQIKVYRVPSKNYKGKDFITCSII